MDKNDKIIEEVLRNGGQEIAFEEIPDENDSPLAQPVVKKSGLDKQAEKLSDDSQSQDSDATPSAGSQTQSEPENDAPEQEVDGVAQENSEDKTQEAEFTIPLSHATLMADSILGVTNNILELGGGYFVTVKKHKDFYDFEELIQVIDEQNSKNIKRLKLDAEDKAMLRPLLIYVLRKQSEVMTPEQQLLTVCLSILMKKAKIVMEIRSENQRLVERLLDIIHRHKDQYRQAAEESTEVPPVKNSPEQENSDMQEFMEVEEIVSPKQTNQTGLPDVAIERFVG